MLERFGMKECKAVGTPSDTNQKLSIKMVDKDNSLVGQIPYQEAVGSLLYLTQSTRPDIAFAENDVSRFNNNHSNEHWIAVKRIFRYLKGTKDYKLHYNKGSENRIIAYSDADWASDVDKRRSCTGYILNVSNGAICWSSKRQSTIALSSTEAEYMALSSTVCEIMWVQQFMKELNNDVDKIIIHCDNQSTIKLAESDAFRPRTKHIDIRYHYLRQKVDDKTITIKFAPSTEMGADSLTKAVPKDKHLFCARKMGLF